jgi:ATP-dependent RNA helicase DeaD
MSFKTLGLCDELLKSADELGFINPMPIQEKAIPVLLSNKKDFVGLAQTGTGKTCAFGLPLIQHIDESFSHTQGVVICPTRELCLQISDDLKKFARHNNVNIIPIYGGASISNQMRKLKTRPHIIVATPGRLIDMMERRAVNLSQVNHAVLDEADEMLNMGFQEDIDHILNATPIHRKIWLFSATMPKGVAAIAKNYLKDPEEVIIGTKNRSAQNISHKCHVIHEKNRYQGLKRIIDFNPDMFGLVFCRTRKDTQTVAEALMQDGYQAEALHGDLSQSQRDYVMRKFRQGSVRILVATDVAARGLDVDDITHVIHYNLPDEMEIYTHRSGRTARAGKSGASIALINTKEKYRIRNIEKKINIKFDFEKLPDGKAICKQQLMSMVDKIVKTDLDNDNIEKYLPDVCDALNQFDKEELIKRFVSLEFNRFLDYYRHADDINVKTSRNRQSEPKAKTKVKNGKRVKIGKTQRFFINVGRLDKINEGAIVRLICDKSGIRSGMIGEIDLNREFSFFEVEQKAAGIVRDSLNNAVLDGRTVKVQKVIKKKKNHKKDSRI